MEVRSLFGLNSLMGYGPTDGPTDGPTGGPMDGQTLKESHVYVTKNVI